MVRSLSLQNSACIESYNLANYILSTFYSLSNKTSVHCDVLLSWSPLPWEPKNYYLFVCFCFLPSHLKAFFRKPYCPAGLPEI